MNSPTIHSDRGRRQKGDRYVLCEAPFGPFRQNVPVPFLPRRRGFTLIELVVAVAIIVLLLIAVGAAWQSITGSSVEQKAINTISAYAAVARTYAMRHQLETVLTIDPRTGQLDLFVWDTHGHIDPDPNYNVAPNIRYVHAPVLDDAARLPNRADPNRPDNLEVRIAPIDYADAGWIREALSRFALCFDAHGRLVARDLTLYFAPDSATGNIPNPPIPAGTFSGQVATLLPGWVATGVLEIVPAVSGDQQWYFQLRTSRGGIAFVPAPNADANDPCSVPVDPLDPDREDFMLNQYTGRAMKLEVQ